MTKVLIIFAVFILIPPILEVIVARHRKKKNSRIAAHFKRDESGQLEKQDDEF